MSRANLIVARCCLNAWCIPVSSPRVRTTGDGQQGAAVAELQFPPELCGMLSQLCHDIRCYESARTSAGTFSRANINMLAYACASCDEPSCQSLLDDCSANAGGCAVDDDCPDGTACANGQCVGEGRLRFTLTWSEVTDLDLHVRAPDGTELSFDNRSAAGGELDIDNTQGGSGAVENVFFTVPAAGEYAYWVHNYSGPGGAFTLTASEEGVEAGRQTGSVGAEAATSPEYTIAFP